MVEHASSQGFLKALYNWSQELLAKSGTSILWWPIVDPGAQTAWPNQSTGLNSLPQPLTEQGTRNSYFKSTIYKISRSLYRNVPTMCRTAFGVHHFLLHLLIYAWHGVPMEVRGQIKGVISSFQHVILGIKLRSAGFIASAFSHRAPLPIKHSYGALCKMKNTASNYIVFVYNFWRIDMFITLSFLT